MRGHIVKRYKNSYTIVLSLGVDPATGKKKQQWVSVKGTKKEAERVEVEGKGTLIMPHTHKTNKAKAEKSKPETKKGT